MTPAGKTDVCSVKLESWAGSTHTKRGWFCSFSVSNLPTATCRHRGARTIFSLAFTNHVRLWKVRPRYGAGWDPLVLFPSVRCMRWGLCPSLPIVKIVSALCSVDASPCTRLSLTVSLNVILQCSKFMVAPLSSRKSVTNRPAASVETDTLKMCCWTKAHLSSTKQSVGP